MAYCTQYFHHFKDASILARDLSAEYGKTIKVNRHGRGFNVHVPEHLWQRAQELLAQAAEKLISQRVNVGAFSAGVLMLMDKQRADALLAEDSLVIEAFRRSDSSLSEASVSEIAEYFSAYSPEQQAGIINNVKGIYHELLFVEAENSDLDFWTAEIMPATNHPGVDVVMSNSITGEVTELQLKATDSASYVADAAVKYPEVTIATTSEVADGGAAYTTTGFSNEELTDDVTQTVEAMQSASEDLMAEEIVGAALTGGMLTGVVGVARALSGKGDSEEIATDVGKAVVRGLLFAFGLSLF